MEADEFLIRNEIYTISDGDGDEEEPEPEVMTPVKEMKYKGVRKRKSGKYSAEIRDPWRKTKKWLGSFSSPEEAALAYDRAAKEIHGPEVDTNFGDTGKFGPVPDHLLWKLNEVALDCTKNSLSYNDVKARSYTIELAKEIQANLDHTLPSFVKCMRPSHVGGSAKLGVPAPFCKAHLPNENLMINLIDEKGEKYLVKYLALKFEFSIGWKEFCIAHGLVEGDSLVFQLVNPTEFQLQVYIVRAQNGLEAVGGDIDFFQKRIESCKRTKMSEATMESNQKTHPVVALEEPGGVKSRSGSEVVGLEALEGKCTKMNEAAMESNQKTHPVIALEEPVGMKSRSGSEVVGLEALEGKLTNMSEAAMESSQKTRSMIAPEEPGGRKCRSGREVVGLEALEGIKFLKTPMEFKDIKSLNSFTVVVNGLIIDSELSEQARSRYYELCCSQKAFLHDNLRKTINCKLAAGIISQTINIADDIRASKLTTSLDEFAEWDSNLEAFERLGMNVGFLRVQITKLVNLIHEIRSRGRDSKKIRETCSNDVKK